MNTVRVQNRGTLTEQLRAAQDLQRRLRPMRSVGLRTRSTTLGTIRTPIAAESTLTNQTTTARWA